MFAPWILFLTIPVFLANLFYNTSPLFMQSSSPTSSWADGPMKLVATPQHLTNKTDIFTRGATYMALVHNSIIRGYNSIYLQAPLVLDADKKDFLGYAITWVNFVESHHADEKDNLFPHLAQTIGDHSIWTESIAEHATFLPGVQKLHSYLEELSDPSALSGDVMITFMDAFRDPFEYHLHHEVATFAALAVHPKAPEEDTLRGSITRNIFRSWSKSSVTDAGRSTVFPFFMLNLDHTAEEGKWADWPPMSSFVKWGLLNVAGAWHSGWWKFSSSDANGQPRELYAFKALEAEKLKEAGKEEL